MHRYSYKQSFGSRTLPFTEDFGSQTCSQGRGTSNKCGMNLHSNKYGLLFTVWRSHHFVFANWTVLMTDPLGQPKDDKKTNKCYHPLHTTDVSIGSDVSARVIECEKKRSACSSARFQFKNRETTTIFLVICGQGGTIVFAWTVLMGFV